MDPSLYLAATTADVGYLKRVGDDGVVHQRTPKDNNVLHIAAEFKNIDFFVLLSHNEQCQPLFSGTNKKGDTPLHVAARVGCDEVVTFLILHSKNDQQHNIDGSDDEESGVAADGEAHKRLLRQTNLQKDTALHLAAQYGHHRVVCLLMEADPELCCLTNNANESALFIATRRGFFNIANSIVTDCPISPSYEGTNKVTALLAAVTHLSLLDLHSSLVRKMVSKHPEIIKQVDALEWTPLHYAAFKGNLSAVLILMERDNSASYILDKFGMSALHVAALAGRTIVLRRMIGVRPDTCDFLNKKGQTILHVAVVGGQSNVVKYILKTPELAGLINDADFNGNTPVHLAAIHQISKIIKILIRDHRVDQTAINNEFEKAFDIVCRNHFAKNDFSDPVFWHMVRREATGVPYFQEQIISELKRLESPKIDRSNTPATADCIQEMKSSSSYDYEHRKRFDTNLLVAILIATVTFTAAFTIPGGFKSNGMLVLEDKVAFHVFLVFDVLSFFVSIFTVFIHFISTTHFGGRFYAREEWILYSIGVMVVAFASSIYVVLPRNSPLGITIYVLCSLVCVTVILAFRFIPVKHKRKIMWLATLSF